MIAYRMFADETLILDTKNGINDGILSAKFKAEVNKPSSMEFSMAATHPLIDNVKLMSTAIILEMMYVEDNIVQDDYYPFIGRVTSINEDMYSNKTFTCEGGAAFDKDYIVLNDLEAYASTPNSLSVKDVLSKCYPTNTGGENTTIGINKYYDSISTHDYDGSETPWTLITQIQKPAPSSESSEESGGTEPTYTYETIENMMNSSVISPFGGVNYFYYSNGYYDQSSYTYYDTILKNDMLITNMYFSRLFYGFKYEKGSPGIVYPTEENGVIVLSYGEEIPSFGLDDNIIDIKPSYVKTDIWTGIMPVGKDGLTISGNKNDSDTNANTIWKNDLVSKYGKIHKVVNFSEVDDRSALNSFGNNYLARFANQDYFAMQSYEINGIEPCEVFEETPFLIKLGYQVVLKLSNDNLAVFPCLSLEHDLFDIQQSRYVIGPLVPDMILNEDFTAVYH